MINIPRKLIDFIKAQPWSSPGVKLTPLEMEYAWELMEEGQWQPGVTWLELRVLGKNDSASLIAQSMSREEEDIASRYVFEEIDLETARIMMLAQLPRNRWT